MVDRKLFFTIDTFQKSFFHFHNWLLITYENFFRIIFKFPGRGADHPPLSKCRGHERVGLYLYSPSGPQWSVIGRTLYSNLAKPSIKFLSCSSCKISGPRKVGPCHHGMARPQVADGGTASDMEGSSEYIE